MLNGCEDAQEAVEAQLSNAKEVGSGGSGVAQATSFYSTTVSDAGGASQSFYNSPGKSGGSATAEEEDCQEEVYLKSRPSEKATYLPSAKRKMGQGERKRIQRQQQQVAEADEAGGVNKALEEAECRRKAEAAERLEEQLRAEREQKLDEVRGLLQSAIAAADGDAFRTALKVARQAGLSEAELRARSDDLAKALQKRERARQEALCALQAALESPQDEHFGETMEEALAEAESLGVHKIAGGAALQTEAKEALEQWKEAEQQRLEATMGLQFAIRRGEADPLQVAIDGARDCGISVSNPLLKEALDMLVTLRVKESEDAEAQDQLEQAIAARSVPLLETAIQVCSLRRLPLQGADTLLKSLQAKAARTLATEDSLRQAIAGGQPEAIRAAAGAAREAEADPHLLQEAETIALNIEASRKRRHNAEVELYLAGNARKAERLEIAIKEAKSAGVEDSKLSDAAEKLEAIHKEEEAARKSLQAASRSGSLKELREAIEASATQLPREDKELVKAIELLQSLEAEERELEAQRRRKAERQKPLNRKEQEAQAALRAARERRVAEAREEASEALRRRDEDALRALLAEGVLEGDDLGEAEAFLQEQEQRKQAAQRDSGLLEFSFDGLERRQFFQASVALNELFTEKYSMQEGTDFKLKVVNGCKSVLVAFRTPEFAQVVSKTALNLAEELGVNHSAALVAQAEVHEPLDFSPALVAVLPGVRQDADALRQKPGRREAEEAIRLAKARAEGAPLPGPEISPTSSLGRTCTSAPAHGSASFSEVQSMARSSTSTPYSGAYVSKGKGGPKGAPDNQREVSRLSKAAVASLQRDRQKAAEFHKDLRTFAGRFKVAAELQGLDRIVLRPLGFVHQAAVRQAREELVQLIAYHFPRRSVRLRVDAERGAGLELSPCQTGFHIDLVEALPGQDLAAGEVIVEIEGHSLEGLDEEVLYETFDACFRDGAQLVVCASGVT